MEYVKLNNGIEMPLISFGVYQIPKEDTKRCVLDAIKSGYRGIDTAQSYFNESEVGDAIVECGVPREELFITTKVWIDHYGYEECKASVEESLRKLKTDYLDLCLLHQPFSDYYGAYRALEDLYAEGKIKAIGVSNFEKSDIENLINNGTVKPMVNQILAHISNTPFDIIEYCESEGIIVEAYSPNGHGEILNKAEIVAMAEKYQVSPAQLAIRYCIELGFVVLPKSGNPDHIVENGQVDFEISAEDMETLKRIERVTDYESNELVFARPRQQ